MSSNGETFFNDTRLGMTVAGRMVVRVVSYVSYLIITVAAFTFLLSDLRWLRASGVILVIFLVDRAVHLHDGDRPLSELPTQGKVNLASYLAPKAFGVLERAFDRSALTKHSVYLEAARELSGLGEVREGLIRLDVKIDEFVQKIGELLEESEGNETQGEGLRAKVEVLVQEGFGEAQRAGHLFIEASDLFSALPLLHDPILDRLMNIFDIDPTDLEHALIFGSLSHSRSWLRKLPSALGGFVLESQRGLRHRVMNRAWTSRPTPTLDRYSTDLTDLARGGHVGFLIGHSAELERLVDTLSRPVNPNALLVGDAGIGKETIVAHLAFLLVKDKVPHALFDKRLVALELGTLVAGATPDELHLRIQTIVQEIFLAGNIILYIPEIHNLLTTSGTAYLSAADALMPVVRSNSFPVIGTTYPREFKTLIEPRSDFLGAFEIVHVNEITEDEAKEVLIYESLLLEEEARVTISFGAVKKAVQLAKKYFRDKFLPSSAEELLKETIVQAQKRGEHVIGPNEIVRVAEEKVNVPLHAVGETEAKQLLALEDTIHERLIDQEEAVRAVADALREYRSGLSRGGGPIATFLFVGPTGVGKTELAKILARIQFGSESQMLRFDMTEYQDKKSFARFIGAPQGETQGVLTEAVRQKPYSLILLDEFEKAFPDILDLFLQVFDDGRLTDNLGRTVDFGNTIIIATSNAHSDIVSEALNRGETMADIAEYLKKKLTDIFKPELLNRFSRVVVFKNLSLDNLRDIVKLNLQDFAASLITQGISLVCDPAAVERLVRLGYDPAFGARPLRRVIDEKLRAPLAKKILAGEIRRGGRARLVLKDDEFQFMVES